MLSFPYSDRASRPRQDFYPAIESFADTICKKNNLSSGSKNYMMVSDIYQDAKDILPRGK